MAKLKACADDIHGQDDDTEWDLGCPNFETAPILTWHLGFQSFDASLVAGFARVMVRWQSAGCHPNDDRFNLGLHLQPATLQCSQSSRSQGMHSTGRSGQDA